MPYDANGKWNNGTPGTPEYGLLGGEGSVAVGLGGAAGLIGQGQNILPYPNFVPSQTTAPSQGSYVNYTPNQPMAQIATPNYKLNSADPKWQNTNIQKFGGATPSYQGLMGQDYNALQTALTTPGEIAAKTAYDQGQNNLTTQMGGRGLYGSSIMSNQSRNALDTPYMNALATNAANAAAQRYGMQASDLQNQNSFNSNMYGQQMGENTAMQGLAAQQGLAQNAQNLNVYGQQMAQNQNMNQFNQQNAQMGMQQNQALYNANAADASRLNEYNLGALSYANQGSKAQTDWANQQALEKMQYDLASNQYSDAQRTQRINEYLALAGRGQVTSAQQQAANQAAAANSIASQNGWLGAGGALLGGLLGGDGNLGTISSWFT